MKNYKHIIKQHIIYLTILVGSVLVLNTLFAGACMFRHITGFLCPFCGMTTAHLAILRGDFALAFSSHHFWYLGIPTLLLGFHTNVIPKYLGKRIGVVCDVLLYTFLCLFIIYNIVRQVVI